MDKSVVVPSFRDYIAAFTAIAPLTDLQMKALQTHYGAPDRTITATQMAHALGYSHYSFANSHYGTLAKHVGLQLDYHPDSFHVALLVSFEKRNGEWHWISRPEVARALEALGWVEARRLPAKEPWGP